MISWRVFLVLTAAVVLPTEWWCVQSAIETQGEVMQAVLRVLFWTGVGWSAVLLWSFPRPALAGLLLSGFLIIPYQVWMLNRLTRFNATMMAFVDSRMRLRLAGKSVPATLDDFPFPAQLRKSIASYRVEEGGREFFVAYFLQGPGITRSYDSRTGWFYYPD